MEQSPVGSSLPQTDLPPLPPHMSSACPCQRINLIREMKNAEAKESSQTRLNNNRLVIKQTPVPLVPP